MAQDLPVMKFSEDGEYLAYSDPCGSLKIWHTSTGILKQEYAPSSHLSSTCSCLSWGPTLHPHHDSTTPVNKKIKTTSGISQSVRNIDLIAMGTVTGSLMLYSLKNADIYTEMINGHTDRINDICWSLKTDSIFTCSADQHIVEWDTATSSVKKKWKSGKGEQFSLFLCNTQHHLLTAGRVILLWDLRTMQVIQTFVGHSTEIFRLFHVPTNAKSCSVERSLHYNNITDVVRPSLDGSYVISSAIGDSKISVRQINLSCNKKKEILSSFSLPEDPIAVDISCEEQVFRLAALTRSGKLAVFEHILNGCQKKPLKPKVVVQLMTRKSNDVEVNSHSLPIVAAGFSRGLHRNIVIAYSDFLQPVFESLLSSELQSCLEREDPKQKMISVDDNVSKIRQPLVSKDVKVSEHRNQRSTKRRKSMTEKTIEESLISLQSIDDNDTSFQPRQAPKADSMAVLLEQGLTSEDKKLLNIILQKTDEMMIRNTVARLKITSVLPLLQELTKRMHGHAQSATNICVWLKHVIQNHQSYITSLPHIREVLWPLLNVMEVSSEVFQKSLNCKQRLDEMIVTVNALRNFRTNKAAMEPAVCEYEQDDSESDID